MSQPTGRLPGILGASARIAAAAGAVGTVALTFYAGRHSRSLVLVLLFAIWVLSPFVFLAMANRISMRWPTVTRALLHAVMLLVAIVSFALYGIAATWPPGHATTRVFVLVPPISWVIIAAVAGFGAMRGRAKISGPSPR